MLSHGGFLAFGQSNSPLPANYQLSLWREFWGVVIRLASGQRINSTRTNFPCASFCARAVLVQFRFVSARAARRAPSAEMAADASFAVLATGHISRVIQLLRSIGQEHCPFPLWQLCGHEARTDWASTGQV